jgi:creatinine amidohydrolase
MTSPEVQELLGRTDVVIIPVGALEQHGPHLPAGTDFLSALERAKLIGQKADALVAPVLLPGLSPYHLEFAGTISLSHDTLQRVYTEAAQSLIGQGFRRILFLNAHVGNQHMVAYVVDRINMETAAIALDLSAVFATLLPSRTVQPTSKFDRHAGVGETSTGLYLFPNLVDMSKAGTNILTLPDHLDKLLPQVVAGDFGSSQIFSAEAMKPKETGKHTSAREMSATGVWSQRDTRESSAQAGRTAAESFINACVAFIEKWKTVRPVAPLLERQSKNE